MSLIDDSIFNYYRLKLISKQTAMKFASDKIAMESNAVITFQINGASLELVLHNAKTRFYFPAAVIDFYDCICVIFQVCADGIKTIENFFLCYLF